MSILVTGATGNVGAQWCASCRRAARPCVRSSATPASCPASSSRSATSPTRSRSARSLEGVDRVFLSSADGPDKVAHETAVVDAAAAAGVDLVVKASTMLAEVGSPLKPLDWNGRSEQHLRRPASRR